MEWINVLWRGVIVNLSPGRKRPLHVFATMRRSSVSSPFPQRSRPANRSLVTSFQPV
ncbi:hypothetical protein WCP94_001077 [Bilophila wadsworthia]